MVHCLSCSMDYFNFSFSVFKVLVFLSPGYKGWTEIKKYGKICIRNDVVKTKHTLELLVLANPLVVRIYALLFDVN